MAIWSCPLLSGPEVATREGMETIGEFPHSDVAAANDCRALGPRRPRKCASGPCVPLVTRAPICLTLGALWNGIEYQSTGCSLMADLYRRNPKVEESPLAGRPDAV
jgi:hypothetical protein